MILNSSSNSFHITNSSISSSHFCKWSKKYSPPYSRTQNIEISFFSIETLINFFLQIIWFHDFNLFIIKTEADKYPFLQ